MSDGTKLVENRNKPLRLGRHVLYTLLARDSKGLEAFADLRAELRYSDAKKEACYGRAVGLIYIADILKPDECNGYPWTKGKYCHIITDSIKLRRPV